MTQKEGWGDNTYVSFCTLWHLKFVFLEYGLDLMLIKPLLSFLFSLFAAAYRFLAF